MPDLSTFESFAAARLCDAKGPVKSRVMTALALVERLREHPDLTLTAHVSGVRNGFRSQNTYARRAIDRLSLKGVFGEYGRRSNDLAVWGQPLLDLFAETGATPDDERAWRDLCDAVQAHLAALWHRIYSADPLRANFGLGTAPAVVADLLRQADDNGTSAQFAYALVGAKLELRLDIELDVRPVNAPDRDPRPAAEHKAADFVVGDAAIEVTLAGPDDKHLRQAEHVVRVWRKEAWLLVRSRDVAAWRAKLDARLGNDAAMATVAAFETFIGQNMAERGGFTRPTTHDELRNLFDRYNARWSGPTDAPRVAW